MRSSDTVGDRPILSGHFCFPVEIEVLSNKTESLTEKILTKVRTVIDKLLGQHRS